MTTPLAVSIADAVRLSGIGRTTIYRAIAKGDLRAQKIGRRTVILMDQLQLWLRNSAEVRRVKYEA